MHPWLSETPHKTAKIVPLRVGSERDVFAPDGLMNALSLVDRSSSPDALLFRTLLRQPWHRNNAGRGGGSARRQVCPRT